MRTEDPLRRTEALTDGLFRELCAELRPKPSMPQPLKTLLPESGSGVIRQKAITHRGSQQPRRPAATGCSRASIWPEWAGFYKPKPSPSFVQCSECLLASAFEVSVTYYLRIPETSELVMLHPCSDVMFAQYSCPWNWMHL